jgi:hypothetical protein
MPSKSPGLGDGFVHDLMPLIKSGFVILRSILDVLIDRIEEAEQTRDIDVRQDIYSSIVDALEDELENIQAEGEYTAAAKAKIEALEAVIAVLTNEMDQLDAKKKQKKKKKRPQKVKIE